MRGHVDYLNMLQHSMNQPTMNIFLLLHLICIQAALNKSKRVHKPFTSIVVLPKQHTYVEPLRVLLL